MVLRWVKTFVKIYVRHIYFSKCINAEIPLRNKQISSIYPDWDIVDN